MADTDFASGLPVRSPQDNDERLLAKIVDGTTPAQKLAVDVNGAASINAAKVAGTAVATDNGISGAGVQRVTLASDGTGQVKLAASSGTDIGKLTANQSVNVTQLAGNAIDIGSGAASTGTARVILATDQPSIPVAPGAPAGTIINHYEAELAIAAGSPATHSITVTALKTFTLRKIIAGASGKMRLEVSINGSVVYVQYNSTANPNIIIDLAGLGITAAAGQVVLLTMVNKDNQAQDLHSTIIGNEV